MHEKGLIHEATMSIFEGSVISMLNSPGASQWWLTVGPAYFDNDQLDNLLVNSNASVHDWTLYFEDEIAKANEQTSE